MQAGLDSLGAVELRNAVASKFSIWVPATLAFDYPTVAALSGFVLEAMPRVRPDAGQSTGGIGLPLLAEVKENLLSKAEIDARVSSLIAGVLGTSVAAERPLMEVF